MLKTKLIDYLQENLIEDILYTEETTEEDDKSLFVCSVWSASSGYSFKFTRTISAQNNRNVQISRDIFLQHLLKDIEKFVKRFDFTEDPMEGLEVLFNDGFDYDESM